MAQSDTIKTVRFDGRNFLSYKASIKAALRARGLWEMLIGVESIPADTGDAASVDARRQWSQRLLVLDDILTNTLDDEHKVAMIEIESPITKWAELVREFETKPFKSVHFLKKKLYTCEYDSAREHVGDYCDRMLAIRRELHGMNVKVADEDMVSAILSGLGKDYESVIDALSAVEGLSVQSCIEYLKSKEERSMELESAAHKGKASESATALMLTRAPQRWQQQAQYMQRRNQVKDVCRLCGKRGHWKRDCWHNPQNHGKQDRRVNLKCYRGRGGRSGRGGRESRGGRGGHGGRGGWQQQSTGRSSSSLPSVEPDDGSHATDSYSRFKAINATTKKAIQNSVMDEGYTTFILDNAATMHTCGDCDAFTELSSGSGRTMLWFDNSKREAEGVGVVQIGVWNASRNSWDPFALNCYFVNGSTNLLSQRKLFRDLGLRASVSYDQDEIVLKNEGVAWRFQLDARDELYKMVVRKVAIAKLNWQAHQINSISATHSQLFRLWHARLAHAHSSTMKGMVRRQTVDGLGLGRYELKTDLECLTCECAKMKRMSFKNTRPYRATRPFERVLMDLAFSTVESPGGVTMILHVLDEATRFKWLYLQKKKNETLTSVADFLQMVDEKYGASVVTLQTDQGGEFTSKAFRKLCGHTIEHIFSHPHAHEEMSLIEKAHSVLFGKIRAVLLASGLPKSLWAEAAGFVVHVENRTGTKALKDYMSPYEALTGKKPSVEHFRTWGCLAMKFIEKHYRANKLAPRAVPTLLMGYASRTKGYRLLNLETGGLDEARAENVVFHEEHTVEKGRVQRLLTLVYTDKVNPELTLPVKLPIIRLSMIELLDEEEGGDAEQQTRMEEGRSSLGATRRLPPDTSRERRECICDEETEGQRPRLEQV